MTHAYFLMSLRQGDRSERGFGMTGNESNPASLFRLYVDYGRHAEATSLLIEYMENLASIVSCTFCLLGLAFRPFEHLQILSDLCSSSS